MGEVHLGRVVPAEGGQCRRALRTRSGANEEAAGVGVEQRGEAGVVSVAARTDRSQQAVEGEDRASPQRCTAEGGREDGGPHDPEAADSRRPTGRRRFRQCDAHRRADAGAHLAHGFRAQRDLVAGRRRPAIDDRDQERAPDALPRQAIDHVAVDAHVARDTGRDGRNAGSLQVVEQPIILRDRTRAVDRERRVERLAVLRRCAGQVGQTRPEHGGAAEDRHRKDRTDEGRADRPGGASASPFQGVADPDEGARRGAGRGQEGDDPRRPHDRVVVAPRDQPRGADGGPDAQREHRHDRHRRATDQEQRVEVEPRGRVGELRLAHGDKEGEQRSQQHPSGRSGEGDRQRAGHGEGEQLTAGGAERAQDGVVVCLQSGSGGPAPGPRR